MRQRAPLIVCKIGWMERYQGFESEVIRSSHGYVKDTGGGGYEAFNFKPYNGRYYGYVSAPAGSRNGARSLKIERLGAAKDMESIDGITVVWIAAHPDEGGVRVVGWYKEATAYRMCQEAKDPHAVIGWVDDQGNVIEEERVCYFFSAPQEKCVLIPPKERTFIVPRGKGWPGQANVYYPAQHGRDDFFYDYIEQYEREHGISDGMKTHGGTYGGGEESQAHKALKEMVATRPELLGLEPEMIEGDAILEYTGLPTSDRPDIVFKLRDGRWVVVEIEVLKPWAGAFQALKYKVLINAYLGADLSSDWVVPWLVFCREAPDRERAIKFCKRYGVNYLLINCNGHGVL